VPTFCTYHELTRNKTIEPGATEVWDVLVTYRIDKPVLVDNSVTCDPDTGIGGFANSIVVSDPNDAPANNDACVMVLVPDTTVNKPVTDPVGAAVAAGGGLTFTITAMNIGGAWLLTWRLRSRYLSPWSGCLLTPLLEALTQTPIYGQ
jgi:hypothetical protein